MVNQLISFCFCKAVDCGLDPESLQRYSPGLLQLCPVRPLRGPRELVPGQPEAEVLEGALRGRAGDCACSKTLGTKDQ